MSTFEKLSKINVNDHVEKKNGLTYLSWAWAWSEFKKACPDATYQVMETEHDENLGYMCHTQVMVEGEVHEMWLPVMDGANKAMKSEPYTYKVKDWKTKQMVEKTVQAATMFDVNKTIMRCLVKNLAMFGLGIYIYAGEDLPETEAMSANVSKEDKKAGSGHPELVKDSEDWKNVVKYINANKQVEMKTLLANIKRKFTLTKAIVKDLEALRK